MNFNKSFLRITNGCPLLQISHKSCGFKSMCTRRSSSILIRRLSEQSSQKYNRVLPQPIAFSFYSSLANEEQKKARPAITVPPLQFPDVAFNPKVSHAEICDALQTCDSVEEQMIVLATTLSLTAEDIENRIYFTKVMESLLKPFFCNIKIQIFGSTLNGFGFKGCDLDMSFEAFVDGKEKISYLEHPDVPLVSEVLSGSVSPAEISLLPPKEQLIFIHTVLLEFYKESEEPIIFINAHVPLIRFYHDKYGLKCDLTSQNNVAFANTKLLYLFGKLDDRVIPLMMTLRYWAKYVELIGKGLQFNTYTISLLVIHFLQTRKDPILPSAEHLMSLSDSLEIQDMSDNSFLEIQKSIPPSKNNQTLNELLQEFFFYYLYFDFTRVICPLIGDSIPREEFLKTSSKKFRMNSICIQDPMDVNHNVAELVDYKTCRKLFTELMIACRLFQSGLDLSPGPSKWGISCLFEKDAHLSRHCTGDKVISFPIPLIKRQAIKDTAEKDANCLVSETLLHLFRHVLLFECQLLKKPEIIERLKMHDEEMKRMKKIGEIKNKSTSDLLESLQKENKKTNISLINLQMFSDALMLEEFQKFNSDNELIACFECKASKNTWLGRDHISLDSLNENILNDLLEKEHYISVEASKQNEVTAKKSTTKKLDPVVFFCECYVSPKFPNSLLLNFRPFQNLNLNPLLGIFLKGYLPKLIKNLNESC